MTKICNCIGDGHGGPCFGCRDQNRYWRWPNPYSDPWEVPPHRPNRYLRRCKECGTMYEIGTGHYCAGIPLLTIEDIRGIMEELNHTVSHRDETPEEKG